MKICILLCILACCSEQIFARSIRKRRKITDLGEYMAKYGYISTANLETGALRSKDDLIKGVKNLQEMVGLKVTGDPTDPALIDLMAKDRCGVMDNKLNSDPLGPANFWIYNVKWDKKLVTWKISSYSVDIDHGEQRKAFTDAFNLWHEEADLDFREVNENDEADIVIKFVTYDHGDGYPFDGTAGTLAHALPPVSHKQVYAHFDEDEEWGVGGKGTDLYIIAAHEFAHSLGIGHTNKQGALMFPVYIGYHPNYELDYDDVQAIQTLYGPPPPGRKTKKPRIKVSTYSTEPPRAPTPPPRVPVEPEGGKPPNPCTTTISDVTLMRSEIYAFKDTWYWRFNLEGNLEDNVPLEVKYFFLSLPKKGIISAVTSIPRIDTSIFFIGTRFYLVSAGQRPDNFPEKGKDIRELGINVEYVDRIDAALTWGFNERVYIFSGDIYWRMSNESRHMSENGKYLRVDKGYPKPIDLWRGIPTPIDGAYTNYKGETFFFKGTQYWGFDDISMTAKENYPKDIASMLNCVYDNERPGKIKSGEEKNIALVSLLISCLLLNAFKF